MGSLKSDLNKKTCRVDFAGFFMGNSSSQVIG
jgi:hypothetical protein